MSESKTILASVDENLDLVTPSDASNVADGANVSDKEMPESPTEPLLQDDGQITEPAESGEQEPSKPEIPETDMLSSLSDEEFEKLYQKTIEDPKSPYHKNAAWIRLKTQRDQRLNEAEAQERRANAILMQLAKTNPELARDYLMSNDGLSPDDVNYLFTQMGIESKKPLEAQSIVNDAEFLRDIKAIGIDYDNLSSEDRSGWKLIYSMMQQRLNPIYQEIQTFKTKEEETKYNEIKNKVSEETQALAKKVKEKYNLDWKNEVEPKLWEYLKSHENFSGNPEQLFNIVFFDSIEDLSKRKKLLEDEKLNKEKAKMNSETPESSEKMATYPTGWGKNWEVTWKTLRNKYK